MWRIVRWLAVMFLVTVAVVFFAAVSAHARGRKSIFDLVATAVS